MKNAMQWVSNSWYLALWRDALRHPELSTRYVARYCLLFVNGFVAIGICVLLIAAVLFADAVHQLWAMR